MPLSGVQRDTPGHRNLRIAGCVLIAAGVFNGIGSILFELVRFVARDHWWVASAIVFLFAFRADGVRMLARSAGLLMLVIWFSNSIPNLDFMAEWIAMRIEDDFLGLMLMVIGVVLLSTNDPAGRSEALLSRFVSQLRARRSTAIALCVAGLWILNPDNAHSTCLATSRFCERHGAYRPAIVFTQLARDTFPSDSSCVMCRSQIRNELSRRIAELSVGDRSDQAAQPRHRDESPTFYSRGNWKTGSTRW